MFFVNLNLVEIFLIDCDRVSWDFFDRVLVGKVLVLGGEGGLEVVFFSCVFLLLLMVEIEVGLMLKEGLDEVIFFILVVDVFSRLIFRGLDRGSIEGFTIGMDDVFVSYL